MIFDIKRQVIEGSASVIFVPLHATPVVGEVMPKNGWDAAMDSTRLFGSSGSLILPDAKAMADPYLTRFLGAVDKDKLGRPYYH